MPASKAEQVLDALKALLETVPDAVVERNSVLPEKIPDGGLIILRDGDPGEPEQALGGFGSTYYQHAVEIEVYVEEGDAAARDAAFDALLQQIGAALEADPTIAALTGRIDVRFIAEHERRVAEVEALRARDGSNAEQVDQLIAQSAAVRDAQLSQLRAKEVEAAEKVRAANERVVESLDAEREALAQTERERFVAQALSRLSAEATAQQRREVEQLAGALFDEQQALQARQRLLDEGRSVIDRTRTATEQHAAEIAKLNELLAAGAIDLATYARAVEDANDRALRSSQAWTDGATRFLKDYVAESNDAADRHRAGVRECVLWCRGLAGRLHQYRQAGVPESRRQHPRRPRAHDGAPDHHGPARRCSAERVRRRRPVRPVPRGRHCGRAAARGALCRRRASSSTRRATTAAASPAPASCRTRSRSSRGAGSWSCRPSGSCARRRSAREQRPITVVVNVTAADASSFRASQGQIAADMARAIDRASRNR